MIDDDFTTEAKNRLDAVLNAFAVDEATRAIVWKRVVAGRYSPDDPMATVTAIETLFERRGGAIVAAINALPGKVDEAAKAAIGPVADAAAGAVEERLAAAQQTASAHLTKVASAAIHKIDGQVATVANAIADDLREWSSSVERRDVLRHGGQLLAVGVVAIGLALGGIAWGVGSWSYNMGRTETVQASNALAALATRPDAATILRYAQNNDFTAATNSWCGTGSTPGAVFVQGAAKCGPFWYDAPPIAGEVSTNIGSIWNLLNAPFMRFPPLVLAAAGAALAGGVVWLRNRRRKV